MNILIYKRTHRGDPDKSGVFGHRDCMGRIRSWNFDAVIGVGGKKPWPNHEDIANRVNWIGVGPQKSKPRKRDWKGPLVTFDRFILCDEKGPKLKTLAPKLFKYMYEDRHVRAVMSKSLSGKIQEEVKRILGLAKKHKRITPSISGGVSNQNKCCRRKRKALSLHVCR